ncbi:hypothetical protein [Pedobacter psychrodurus]|uniref:hypothetical protein n=1 Tax=Pedobacter psychrodurus TaxID=2530456 RepID=UPI00293171E3|nr:hypothetical protein [Pedobacter psychrodurus]
MKNLMLSLALMLVAFSSKSFTTIEYKNLSSIDSTQTYIILGKSPAIESVIVRKSKKKGNILYVSVGNKKLNATDNNMTGLGLQGKSESKEARNASGPVFDQIEVLNGGYDEIKVDKISTTQNIYTIKNINFPLRLKMHSGKDYVEFELKDAGRWDVNVNYKNN